MSKSLLDIHEDVPPNHYDNGIKTNPFQRYWHKKRFVELLKVVSKARGRVLDVGCHAGTFTEVLLPKLDTKDIFGVDVSPNAIKLAKKRIPYGDFQVADAVSLPFRKNHFTHILCLEMLEHVENPKKVISEISRVLKKGGDVVILVPEDNLLFKLVWKLWTFYYPVWDHAHVQSFKGPDIEKLLKKNGFKITLSKTFNLGMLKLTKAVKK